MKRNLFILFLSAGCLLFPVSADASPWSQKDGYLARTGGKFVFGLKHSLLSWTAPWTEANEPAYDKPWQGFCVGIGKTVVYTATGLIQLATFPLPVDFPDVGLGLHVADRHCPERHSGYRQEKSRAMDEDLQNLAKSYSS